MQEIIFNGGLGAWCTSEEIAIKYEREAKDWDKKSQVFQNKINELKNGKQQVEYEAQLKVLKATENSLLMLFDQQKQQITLGKALGVNLIVEETLALSNKANYKPYNALGWWCNEGVEHRIKAEKTMTEAINRASELEGSLATLRKQQEEQLRAVKMQIIELQAEIKRAKLLLNRINEKIEEYKINRTKSEQKQKEELIQKAKTEDEKVAVKTLTNNKNMMFGFGAIALLGLFFIVKK